MLTSWFAIPYNLEGLNSDAKTVYHTGLGFNLSLDTVFLYRRQMTRFLCLPGIVFLVLFMEGAGLSFQDPCLIQEFRYWFSAFCEPQTRLLPPFRHYSSSHGPWATTLSALYWKFWF